RMAEPKARYLAEQRLDALAARLERLEPQSAARWLEQWKALGWKPRKTPVPSFSGSPVATGRTIFRECATVSCPSIVFDATENALWAKPMVGEFKQVEMTPLLFNLKELYGKPDHNQWFEQLSRALEQAPRESILLVMLQSQRQSSRSLVMQLLHTLLYRFL